MKIRTLFILLALGLSTAMGMAQNPPAKVTIQGIVKDPGGTPIIGAIVRVDGTKQGAVTDVSGQFTLELEAPAAITVSYVGMEPLHTTLSPQKGTITLTMLESVLTLDGVVATGFYKTKQEKVAGSYVKVPEQPLIRNISPTVDGKLQGVIPGVVVTRTTGQPGATAKIRIRGTSTVLGTSEPLWVVDGVPVQDMMPEISEQQIKSSDLNELFKNGLAEINPEDIESITVLKDAAATAIYGSRSAGGVIVLTTKRGRRGKTSVSYSNNLTVTLRPERSPLLMDSSEKIEWEKELWQEFAAPYVGKRGAHVPIVGVVGMVYGDKIGKGGKLSGEEGFEPMSPTEKEEYLNRLKQINTDWFGEIFQNGFSHDHNLSVSGGSDRSTYHTSFRYTSDRGLLKKSSFDRYILGLRMQVDLSDRLKMLPSASLSRMESRAFSTSVDPVEYAYYANPYEAPYNADGSYRPDQTFLNLAPINDSPLKPVINPLGINILRDMNESTGINKKLTTQVTNELRWKILPRLEWGAIGSYTYASNSVTDEVGPRTSRAFENRLPHDMDAHQWTPYGYIMQSTNHSESYLLRTTLMYSPTFADRHDLRLLAGAEIRSNTNKRTYSKRYGYDAETQIQETPRPRDLKSIKNPEYYADQWDKNTGEVTVENKYASFFLSADYTYKNRYVVNSSFRMDGSNNFGSKEQFNPTASLGLAWHLINEPYADRLKDYFSTLTLRVSSGLTGNVVQGVDKELVVKYNRYLWRGFRTGEINQAPNPNLRWEKTWDRQVALHMSSLNNRLSLVLEGYKRTSYDVITSGGIVSTTGFTNQKYNASTIENTGLEVTCNADLLRHKDYHLRMGLNFAWNENRLLKFEPMVPGSAPDGKFRDYPLGAVFLGKSLGIDPWTGLYDFALSPNAKIRSARDFNRHTNYRFYLGTAMAPYSGGISLSAGYKGLSLYVGGHYSFTSVVKSTLQSPAKYDTVNRRRRAKEIPQTPYADLYRNHLNVTKDATDRWTPEHGYDVKYPRIIDPFGPSLNLNYLAPDDHRITGGVFAQRVAYLKLNTISLAYNLPDRLLLPISLKRATITCTLNNFFTFTNFKGFDPESPNALYPGTRSATVSLRIGI